MQRIRSILFAGCLASSAQVAHADLAADLNNFFNSAGMLSNVTAPGAYEGQSAGYYTGGSIYARAPSRNFNLVTIQAPSLRAGCGGIDLFTGSFSFIDSAQLVAAMRNIGANATGLAFQIGLSTISPKLAEHLQEFIDLANQVNQFNINSCETAATLLGGALPKTQATQKTLCSLIGTRFGGFSDYAAGRQQCGTGGQTSVQLRNPTPEYGEQNPSGNIVWRALRKNSVAAGDRQLAEFLMTLTGTVVIPPTSNDDQPAQLQAFPPLPATDELLQAFLSGNTGGSNPVQLPFLYDCNGDYTGCINVRKRSNVPLPAGTIGFRAAIEQTLQNILDNMDIDAQGNTPSLTAPAIALIENARIPVLKILTVYHAYNPNFAAQKIPALARLLALDLLDQYFQQTYDMVLQSLHSVDLDPESSGKNIVIDNIDRQRRTMERLIAKHQKELYRGINFDMEVMTVERALVSRLSPGLASAYAWGKNVR